MGDHSLMIDTADGSYRIWWDNEIVSSNEARQKYAEAVMEFGETVEMSMSAQRLVGLDFDKYKLKEFYDSCDK